MVMPLQGMMPNQGTSPMGEAPYQPAQVPLTPPEQEPPESEDEQQEREQEVELHRQNIAEKIDDDKLAALGSECKTGFETDLDSMKEWLTANEEWSKLARQVKEEKTFPWPGASNIKYPLISTAALQFSARAYPALIPADKKLVKTRVIGKDPSGQKRQKADRISTYMSWQFTEDMDRWEEEMDKLLIMNAVVGQTYKKTYYDPSCEKIVSRLVYAENFIIDKWARSIEQCERYSEIHLMTQQQVKELQLREYFLDIDLGIPTGRVDDNSDRNPNTIDFTTPYEIIEQHTWADLDPKGNEGFREPYIIWFERNSGKILRIQARFDAEGIKVDKDNKVVGYDAKCYYTKFGFIPNPDGSFLDIGFGHLLGPINEAVNSNINQLTDAGTINNLQAGFIAKGLRLNMADKTWKPGEWKSVNATGDDLRKQIVPLPSKEPSPVLFQLLGMLIQAGKELASVAEIFTGKMPGQNTPATTTQATIEQGMKVFTAIYKRIYRSLDEEFKKVFYLNQYYLNPETYVRVLDESIGPDDFDDDTFDIQPTADPTATTQGEKLQKASVLMQLMGTGILDPMKVMIRVLEANEIPAWQELIPGMAETGQPAPPQPKPDPKMLAQQQAAKIQEQQAQAQDQRDERKMQMELSSDAAKLQMKQQEHVMDMQNKQEMHQLEAQGKQALNEVFMAEAKNKAVTSALEGHQKLTQKDAEHKQKLQQMKETAKSSPKQTSKSGKKAK